MNNSDQLQKHQIKCKLKLSLSRTHEHMKNELYTDKKWSTHHKSVLLTAVSY